jgi:hypothetical protein
MAAGTAGHVLDTRSQIIYQPSYRVPSDDVRGYDLTMRPVTRVAPTLVLRLILEYPDFWVIPSD